MPSMSCGFLSLRNSEEKKPRFLLGSAVLFVLFLGLFERHAAGVLVINGNVGFPDAEI